MLLIPLSLLLSSILVSTGVHGQDDTAADRIAQYDRCLRLAETRPPEGLALADAWLDTGGGGPARHCQAIALNTLERFADAARTLELVADDIRAGDGLLSRLDPESNDFKALHAGVLAQAGNSWLLAGDTEQAQTLFGRALEAGPDENYVRLELLIDRARAAGGGKRYAVALADLRTALAIDPDRADALLYAATAARHLDQLDEALGHIENALDKRPDWPQALLERGNIKALFGDDDGARSDWLQVLRFETEGPTAVAARANLAALDIRIDSDQPD